MHRSTFLFFTAFLAGRSPELAYATCDATDSSCHVTSEPERGKALLQHDAKTASVLTTNSAKEASATTNSLQSQKVCKGKTHEIGKKTSPFTAGYGAYYSKDETLPAWMGLRCENYCFNGWKPGKCAWPACNGCLRQKDGSATGCKIPKYASGKKNVLLLMTDDLNVDVEGFEYGHAQAYTPNIKSLAESGTQFDYAYAVHPLCTPSRASFMTGILGIHSKNMFKDKYWDNPVLKKSRTWVEMFKLNGYYTVGTGKIGHNEKKDMFEVWGHDPNYGPVWRTNGAPKAHPKMTNPIAAWGSIDFSFGRFSTAKEFITDTDGTDISKSGWAYSHAGKLEPMCYNTDEDRDETPDEMNANFAIQQLDANDYMKHASWLMAVGIVRPHTPLHVDDKYFDYFPLDKVSLPDIDPTDNNDIHFKSVRGQTMHDDLVETYGYETGLKLAAQAYLASVMAADEQIGKVLDKLSEDETVEQNTIVVMTSDHGFHLGQKQVLWKNTVWDQGARIPLIIKHPDMQPNHVQFPVSLIDIFPTLMDLAELENKDTSLEEGSHELDGFSLKPLMKDPSYAGFPRAGAITIIPQDEWSYTNTKSRFKGNPLVFSMAVRMNKYRYIIANGGGEELYNNAEDHYEWKNLANTADMNDELLEVKKNAIAVLNDELREHGKDLNAETEPRTCDKALWVSCN